MSNVPALTDAQLEQVSRLLGDCATGSEITRVLNSLRLNDVSGESTKWRRLYGTFLHYQRQDRAASKLIDFIRTLLDPAGFVGRPDEFEAVRQQLNAVLAFAGLQYGEDGTFRGLRRRRPSSRPTSVPKRCKPSSGAVASTPRSSSTASPNCYRITISTPCSRLPRGSRRGSGSCQVRTATARRWWIECSPSSVQC